jgi:hypothetical protein
MLNKKSLALTSMNTNETGDNSTAKPNGESSVDRVESSRFSEQDLASILRRDFGNLDKSETEVEPSDNNGSEIQSINTDEKDALNFLDYGEEVHSQEEEATDSEDSEFQTKGVQKRIDKLTALRKSAEEQAEKLKNELEQLKLQVESNKSNGIVITKDEGLPYAHINSLAEIDAEIAQARQVRRWCEENSNGVIVQNPDGTESEYSTDDVKRIKLNAIDALEEHLPKRLNYIQTKEKIDSIAYKEYPWLKDKSSKERQIAEAFIKALPQITRFPDFNIIIGDYINGVKARESSQKGNNIKKAPVQPTSNYAPSSRYKDAGDVDAVRRYVKTNSSVDLTAIIKSKFI